MADKKMPYYNRELSWMDFNARCLEEALRKDNPLMERLRFLAITGSNLDEFFMVRVAGVKDQVNSGYKQKGNSFDLTPQELLPLLEEKTHRFMERQYSCLHRSIMPALEKQGVRFLSVEEMDKEQKAYLSQYFQKVLFPVLTPLAVDGSRPFPLLANKSLNIAVCLKSKEHNKDKEEKVFAIVQVPSILPRFLELPAKEGRQFTLLEDVIIHNLDELFELHNIVAACPFRITRNSDLEIDEEAEDFMSEVKKSIKKRKRGAPVRLELLTKCSADIKAFLIEMLGIKKNEIYELPGPLDLTFFSKFAGVKGFESLCFVPIRPVNPPADFWGYTDIFEAIREKDRMVHHPYESFDVVVRFIEQAAEDENVLAIKQTLYRTSSNSPIIDALIDAAHAGKQVLALVEIKARFDEDANIAWARKLERAGVHVVYGIVGLKTHCKLSLVVRQEADGLRRYCHVGTGNYNPKTARIYTDLGLLTCDPVVGQDMTRLFNQLSGYAPKSSFHRLLVAPRTVRSGLIQRIRREEDAARAGKEAWIKIKVNSIVDEKTIDALYRASQAGVKIDIVERGICALKPGIPGLSENIRVRSILGRFLEHSRIYAFANSDGPQIGEGPAAGPEVWIGSADLMHRNLDRRVEALVRIVAPEQIDELIKYVDLQMADSTASWHMQADGTYVRHCKDEEGRPLVDSQEYLIKKHTRRPVRH